MAKRKRKRSTSPSPRPVAKKKTQWSKWVWLFILGQLAGYVGIFALMESTFQPKPKGDNGIFITAAHLPESSIDSKYKLLYEDAETDKAYYLDTTYVGPSVSFQKVSIEGLSGAEVVSSSKGKFTVAVEDPQQIVAGLSGSRVYSYDGSKLLGFVSAMEPGGKLLCIAID